MLSHFLCQIEIHKKKNKCRLKTFSESIWLELLRISKDDSSSYQPLILKEQDEERGVEPFSQILKAHMQLVEWLANYSRATGSQMWMRFSVNTKGFSVHVGTCLNVVRRSPEPPTNLQGQICNAPPPPHPLATDRRRLMVRGGFAHFPLFVIGSL
ncbi:hypothetical protein AVEN_231728-1 [Araneus ventricosus]|uniref:Uncharacterized protein n=1 Tax=Araneus ventricosus TaxID=182803 RepID=A0A4Y2QTD3_ARAVE|nr:hypothetical protein AVEN_231728-1 [Araneus ventricosus]